MVPVGTGTHLVQQQFQYAVQHPVMFEAIIALAQANSTVNRWTDQTGDRLTLYHYGQAIARLRQAISSAQESMEDAVLFAIMALMGVNYLLNDLRAFQANLLGLRRLVDLRGGVDALGWPALLKPGLVALESFWAYLSQQPHLLQGQSAISATAGAKIDLTPTLHSVGPIPAVEEMLPRLPAGFRVLAEQRRLGRSLVYLIHQISAYDLSLQHAVPTYLIHRGAVRKVTNFKTPDNREVTVASNLHFCEQLASLLATSELNSLEKVFCIGAFIVLLGSARTEQLSPIYFTQLQHHAGELLEIAMDENDPVAADLVAWSIFNVASTLVPSKLSSLPNNYQDDVRFALTVKVVTHFSATRTWDDMQRALQRFIWNDGCGSSWKHVWDLGLEHARNRVEDVSGQ